MDREMIDLEIARIVRQAHEAVEKKIQARQLGEAFKGLSPTFYSDELSDLSCP